ncbi:MULTISPECIES: DUF1127 domain-containing protein [unclassified Marinovum]
MAQVTTNLHIERPSIWERIGNFLVSIAENDHRIKKVDFLNGLSDAELTKRGIRREDIVRHVFADSMGI